MQECEARWTAEKWESGVRWRVVGECEIGVTKNDGYGYFRWGRAKGERGYAVKTARVLVALREGRRLDDYRWDAHHVRKTAGGKRHVRWGGPVEGQKAKGGHRKGHAVEGGLAAAKVAKEKVAARKRLAARMQVD